MPEKAPLNMTILDPKEYIPRKGCLPVSNHAIYEASTSRFHPEGLFSEVIFGQIGSNERLVKKGYLDLKTTVITPHLYKQLITLKSYYKDIAAGREYAYFDQDLKDLVKTSAEDPQGNTGYSYFLSMIPKIKFAETGSSKRQDKIDLMTKYKDRLFINQLIILPAGLRDVREEHGRVSPEEINKYYLGLLSLTQALPDNDTDDPVFDAIRYQIQMKVQQVYNYISNLITGKGGFGQSKYAARSVVYGNRNVISAYPLSRAESSSSPNLFRSDEVIVPLFQAMKAAVPLVVNKLKSAFFETVFNGQNTTVPLINSKYQLEYVEVDSRDFTKFTSSDGIETIINSMRNEHKYFQPVTIRGIDKKEYFLYLVYDEGDTLYLIRNLSDLENRLNGTELDVTKLNLTLLDGIINVEDVIFTRDSVLHLYGYPNVGNKLDIVIPEDKYKEITSDWKDMKDGSLKHPDREVYAWKDTPTDVKQVAYCKLVSVSELVKIYTGNINKKKVKFVNSLVFDPTKLRPLTYAEMCYMATYVAVGRDGVCTASRYPILNLHGIVPFKVHPVTTMPGRIVTIKNLSASDAGMLFPEYPVHHGVIKSSMSVHGSTLPAYAGRWLPALNRGKNLESPSTRTIRGEGSM